MISLAFAPLLHLLTFSSGPLGSISLRRWGRRGRKKSVLLYLAQENAHWGVAQLEGSGCSRLKVMFEKEEVRGRERENERMMPFPSLLFRGGTSLCFFPRFLPTPSALCLSVVISLSLYFCSSVDSCCHFLFLVRTLRIESGLPPLHYKFSFCAGEFSPFCRVMVLKTRKHSKKILGIKTVVFFCPSYHVATQVMEMRRQHRSP